MAELSATGNNILFLTQNVVVANKKTVPFYGTLADADNYFYMHPQYAVWNDQEQDDKMRFLVGATRIVDRLNFVGQKKADDQQLQFPRTCAADVPVPIIQAVYEIALKLADGFDSDTEGRNLSVRSQGYAGSKTDYDRTFVPDYIRAGVPSQGAWLLLYPYLRDPNQLNLVRNS